MLWKVASTVAFGHLMIRILLHELVKNSFEVKIGQNGDTIAAEGLGVGLLFIKRCIVWVVLSENAWLEKVKGHEIIY